ncbi:MAG: PAS domain-containing protein, partial [Proteobacteria bacterium]|nr:PAS domain-containing protein [Pseudomonadota bacterium]
ERRYRRLYDSVAVGIFRSDAAGRLTGANRGLVALLGYRSEAELLAADFGAQAYLGPGTYEALLARVRMQGALEMPEVRLRRSDGRSVAVLASIEAVWGEDGAAEGFEATLLDVSRERLAVGQRRSLEVRLRRLFDAPGVGLLAANLRRGTLEEANATVLELLGLRPSELPVPLERLVPEDQRALQRGALSVLELGGAVGPLDCEYRRIDGGRVAVRISVVMVDPQQGECLAIVLGRGPDGRAEGVPAAGGPVINDAGDRPCVDGRRTA